MLSLAHCLGQSILERVSMEIKAKFWIENKGEVVLGGQGKTALLLAVDRLGSIQRAANELGMSYRHAWGAIQRIEQRAGFKMVETKLGGSDKGTRLTSEGKAFVKRSDALFRELQAIVKKRFRKKLQDFVDVKGGHDAAVGQRL